MLQTILLIFIGVILFSAAVAGISAAPWLPTKPKQRQLMLKAANMQETETCYDLGCGDGSMLFAVAKKHPLVHGIGYDISLLPLLIGWIRKFISFSRYKNVHLRFGNLFSQPLHDADVIFVFLLNKSYPRLIKKFRKELKPSARVIVEAWPLPNIDPVKTIKEDGFLPIYVYNTTSFK